MGKWVEGYGFSHKDIGIAEFFINNQTIRYIVPIGISGSKIEIILSNQFGTEDLILDKVTVGRITKEDHIEHDNLSLVTHNNSMKITIPKGGDVVCDILDCDVLAGEELGISIYIKDKSQIQSGGSNVGRRYVSIEGDYTENQKIPYIITQVDMQENELDYFTEPTVDIIKKINVFTKKSYCIAAFGDSITAMDYWRRPLAKNYRKIWGLVTV